MSKSYKSLAQYIEQSGETQEQLAARAGVSQPTISRAVNGEPVRLATAKLLARLTGVPLESFGQDAA